MATAFDRWEKDPFFYAAEEVQESADRMESVYRRWIHEKSTPEYAGGDADACATKLRRELHTALGTAKWQLEELERAVRSSDHSLSAGEATTTRHSDFAAAICGKISMVENALKESNLEGDGGLAWVRLDEGERDELALFLSCLNHEVEKALPTPSAGVVHEVGNRMNVKTNVCSKNPCQSNELILPEVKEEEEKCHRRVASAADLGVWKISVSVEASPQKLLDEQPNIPPPRIISLSELRNMESTSRPKWYKNGFRKWRAPSHEDAEESIPLQNHHLSRDINACYEKGKSCLSGCADEPYNKELYGWFGAFQRQVQRSQYQIKYGRPVQMIMLTVLTVLLIGVCCVHQSSRPVG